MSQRNFYLTENEAKALFVSSSITNVMDAFLEEKYGNHYIKYREETLKRWIEANRKAVEARASRAQTTTKNNFKHTTHEAAKE